jgi:hypothetical protein
MKQTNMTFRRIAISTGLMLGAFSLSVIAQSTQGTWTAAPVPPPDCLVTTQGCNAPINTGLTDQTKSGPLRLVDLVVSRLNALGDVPVAGDVLTAKDATGAVEWKKQGFDFSGTGTVYNTNILGNGNTTLLRVNSAGSKGVVLNINKGGNECRDLKVELYARAGTPTNAPTYNYGSETGTAPYYYLGYIFGATRDGTTRETGQVVTLPVSAAGYIMLKSNTDAGTPCAVTITKIADIY